MKRVTECLATSLLFTCLAAPSMAQVVGGGILPTGGGILPTGGGILIGGGILPTGGGILPTGGGILIGGGVKGYVSGMVTLTIVTASSYYSGDDFKVTMTDSSGNQFYSNTLRTQSCSPESFQIPFQVPSTFLDPQKTFGDYQVTVVEDLDHANPSGTAPTVTGPMVLPSGGGSHSLTFMADLRAAAITLGESSATNPSFCN
jgi:hypothetical protein